MSFYSQLAQTAAKLIKEKGQAVQLKRKPRSAYDPATGITEGAEETLAASAVVTDFPLGKVDGSLIMAGDRELIMESVASDPAEWDAVVIGGVRNTIVRSKPVAPGGTVVIYKVQVRRGG